MLIPDRGKTKAEASGNIFKLNIKGISCNSRSVQEGFIFVAIHGTKQDGNKFIEEAVASGAKVVVVERHSYKPCELLHKAVFVEVENSRQALARLAAAFYGHPSSKVKVVGITGTNGKTTVSYLIESIVKEAGYLPAVIGTINYRFKNRVFPSKNTTPGSVELQSMLKGMADEGIKYAAMEVSSHALEQGRTEGIDFHSAVFTNLTSDHLDYHRTVGNYFLAKARLFAGLDKKSFCVINNDDAYAERLKEVTKAKVVTYGIQNKSDIMAGEINMDMSHTRFRLYSAAGCRELDTRLIGRHNVYNVLAAAAWGVREAIDPGVIKSALEKFDHVPGRLERVDSLKGFSVFVDYAHTEDALNNVITALRDICRNRIIAVFGCGGERDKSKRSKMGRVVSELADYAIITNDNPRSEDPCSIIEDINIRL